MDHVQAIPAQPARRLSRWLYALIAVAVGAAGYVGLCAYAASLTTLYPNCHINGVAVGALTPQEAQARLDQTLPSQVITLTEPQSGVHTSVTLSQLGYAPAAFAEFAADQKRSERQSPFLKKGWDYLASALGWRTGADRWPTPKAATWEAALRRLEDALTQPPVDGSFSLEGDRLHLTKAKDGRAPEDLAALLSDMAAVRAKGYRLSIRLEPLQGRAITAQAAYDALCTEKANARYDVETGAILPERTGVHFDRSAVQAALNAAAPGDTLSLPVELQMPEVTAQDLETLLFRDVLGESRTRVTGAAGRITNVKLSAAAINGYVLNAGDEFSYNGVVGQRTVQQGYQAGPAYIGGQTVNEIGGGICQTSSTLYLACLRADLAIVERYAHRFVPSYILWGADATVSWGTLDYRFANDTLYPVKIVTTYEDGYLTVKLLGTNLTGRRAEVTNEILSTTPYETIYQEDASLPPGSPDVVAVTPYTGYKVRTFHTLYDAQGNVLDRHYEATSTYKPRDQVVRQAPGGGGTSDAPQIPDDLVEEVFVPGLPSPGEPEEPALPTSDAP